MKALGRSPMPALRRDCRRLVPAARRSAVPARRRDRVRGLALVAVLWIVSALMIVTSGVVYAVRGEVRTVASFREIAAASAIGDAGVIFAARQLTGAKNRESRLLQSEFSFEEVAVGMRIVPLTGLIDLNAAPEPLLADLISVAGEVERGRASRLAQRVIDWRDADDQPQPDGAEDPAYAAAGSPFRTRGGPFEAPEDLLQVLDVDFDLFQRLRPLVTVHAGANGRVDPAAAPLPVLRVLAGGNEQIASAYVAAREASGALADSTRFPAAFIARAPSPRYLIEASVPLSNGAFLVTRRVVDVTTAREGLPWETLWAERVVEAQLGG